MRIAFTFTIHSVKGKNSNFVHKMPNLDPLKKDLVCMYTKAEIKVSEHADYIR